MGILQEAGGALGAAFSPAATAGGAAAQSLGLGTVATGINAVAPLISASGQKSQADFAASVADQNAQAALLAGQTAGSASKMKYGALEAEQDVSQAANGVQVDSGSALKTRQSTEAISSMDAALIHYNAEREAYGQSTQATLDRAAGKGAIAKGVLAAGTSLLSGAQSLSDKWLQYKLSGALKAPGGY